MSAILIARMNNREIGRVQLGSNEVVLGRSRKSDLVLDHDGVSRRHARVTPTEDGFILSDEGSQNGIEVAGALLENPILLTDNLTFNIDPFTITFHADATPAGMPLNDDDDEDGVTRFVSQKELKKVLPGKPTEKAESSDPIRVRLLLLDGPLKDARFENWSGDLTIGRGLDNHVVLIDDAVSIYHARIYRKGEDYHLEDLGSSNGTFLKGIRCVKEPLRNKDRIRVGVTTMLFTRIDVRQQKKIRLFSIVGGIVALLFIMVLALVAPDDAAELAAGRGHALYNQGQYEQARDAFEEALGANSHNESARRGMELLRRRDDRIRTYTEAVAAMNEQNFDRALELCDIIIRNYPASEARDASNLKDIIQRLQEAMIAYHAANWADAVRLFREIAADNPNIQFIRRYQDLAEREGTSLRALQNARNAAGQRQLDYAEDQLHLVRTDSQYYAEATALREALNWYREFERLEQRGEMNEIRQARVDLADPDPALGHLGLDPNALRDRIDERLRVIAAERVSEAAAQLRSGDRRAAHASYRLALEAHPENADARDGIQQIESLVARDARRISIEARRLASVGMIEDAIAEYQRIMDASLVGDRFYNAARRDIERLSR